MNRVCESDNAVEERVNRGDENTGILGNFGKTRVFWGHQIL